MKCRLCLQEKTLIRTSHVIPSFMYKGILEKNKKIVELNLHNFNDATYRPTGIYDQHILCKECDNETIGGLESYAAKILYENQGVDLMIEEGDEIINIMFKGIDYKKFKLFLLSILWRASLSRQQMFKEIELGSKYEEIIRKMIVEGNPKKKEDFPVCIIGLKSNENLALRTIVAPRRMKNDGNTSYMFFINGLFYWFNVSRYNMEDVFTRIPIDDNNEMTIGVLKNQFGASFLDSFIGRKLRFSRKH
jgi:hypothetical protein